MKSQNRSTKRSYPILTMSNSTKLKFGRVRSQELASQRTDEAHRVSPQALMPPPESWLPLVSSGDNLAIWKQYTENFRKLASFFMPNPPTSGPPTG